MSTNPTLYLPLKAEYFDAIKAGTKTEEYRLATPYWRRRLEGQHFSRIELMRGYPAAGDTARRLNLPWRGYTIKTITHEFFGPEPVTVFALKVSDQSSTHQENPVNADRPSILTPAEYGAPFEGGFYGGKIASHGGRKIFAVVWAPKALGETKQIWLPSYTDVPNAASCFHSMDNTVAMAEAGSPLAQWARGLNINGHTDWCIPARDVLELAYRHLKPTDDENSGSFRDGDNPSSIPAGYPYTEQLPAQTAAEAFRAGGPEAFEPTWYWSSTQYSSYYAWNQYVYYGDQNYNVKEYEARARAVRLIQLNP